MGSARRVGARVGVRLPEEGGGAAGQLDHAARLLRPRVADGDGRDDQVGDLDRARAAAPPRGGAAHALGSMDRSRGCVCPAGEVQCRPALR